MSSNDLDDDFIYGLLAAYGKPKSSIARLKSGATNQSKDGSVVSWRKVVYFQVAAKGELLYTIDTLKNDAMVLKAFPRFIVVTDLVNLLAVDTKTQETLDIEIKDLENNVTFFLPWAGMEKASIAEESVADRKAAYKMAALYDEIRRNEENSSTDKDFVHSLNVFFSRLLFCFFAEDTEVFEKGQFTNSIKSHTQEDGKKLNKYLDDLFEALDVKDKSAFPSHLKDFPYVNGGLFSKRLNSPIFTSKARDLILECGRLNWAEINPDIFGSMMQAVVDKGDRSSLGMHYTSVSNIMKVIEPLFLNELKEEYENSIDSISKLNKLLARIQAIKVFDPACGSGNFLIIAYKELRRIENEILLRMKELEFQKAKVKDESAGSGLNLFLDSGIKLEHFYGIEIDDFAHEIAILSLWLAKHQMNIEFKELFGADVSLIPLKDTGNIVCANAARIDWGEVCKNDGSTDVYLIGNPPYHGARLQSKQEKADLEFSMQGTPYSKNLDYISIWFLKGAKYINNDRSQLAFVSTNSICQGEHVGLLFPHLYKLDVEISFAHTSFKWGNNAKANAGVTCIILGLRKRAKDKKKLLYSGEIKIETSNINPYLAPGRSDLIIGTRTKPISGLPTMQFGSMPNSKDLILTEAMKNEIVLIDQRAINFIKPYIGADEFLDGKLRYCVWVNDDAIKAAEAIPVLFEIFQKVKKSRLKSKRKATNKLAAVPYKFGETRFKESDAILIPEVSSERRFYIPMGFVEKGTVISNRAFTIYDAEPWVLGVLVSRMHMVWVKAVAGRLESRINYSNTIVYNNFPIKISSDSTKIAIENSVFDIIRVREKHTELNLKQMYDPDKMPDDLRQAHKELDEVVDRCYQTKQFLNDEERLSHLFELYEKMIAEEKGQLHA